ncbi:MAG: alpha/beta hydrolase, partial [Myxococcota bacterium]
MAPNGFEWIGDPEAPTRMWFVHGILGQGRNWRSFAQRWRAGDAARSAVLVDLRNHGGHPPASPPHDLAACARDLQGHIAREGMPSTLVGHSFGGKVVLQWLGDHAPSDSLRSRGQNLLETRSEPTPATGTEVVGGAL